MTRISKSLVLILSVVIAAAMFAAMPDTAVSIDSPGVTVPTDSDEPVILAAEEPAAEAQDSGETNSWVWTAVGLGSAVILVLIFMLRPRDDSSGPT